MTDTAMIQHTASVLFQPGTVAELRILDTPRGTVSGYFDNGQAFTQDAQQWSEKAPAVYCTLNPCIPALLARAANRLKDRVKSTTSDKDIVQRYWFPLDFDPVRPADISSTDAEHDAALQRAEACAVWLRSRGWPDPVAADSGNGGHRLYRIDLPNDDDSRALLQRCLEALAMYFTDSVVALDVGVFNAARIWKVYGTMACKGDNLPERPHRLSRLLDVPATLACVTRQQLQDVADLLPAPATSTPHRGMPYGVPFDLPQWIASRGLPVVSEGPWQQSGYRWVLNPCPWNSAHTNRSAFVVQFASGAIAAGCHHNGCHGNNWHALRDLYEPGWQTRPRAATFHVSRNGHDTPPSATPIPSITSGQAQQPGIAPAHRQQADLDAVEAAQQAADALLHTLSTLADEAKEDAILDALPALAPLDTISWMRLKRKLKEAVPALNLNDLAQARSELRQASTSQATAPAGSAQAQIAAVLAQEYARQLAYETNRKAWMVYANGLWTSTDTEYIQQRIASYMDALLHGEYSWYELSGVEHLLGRRLAQTLTLETPGWLPFRNGALHLETMTLHPHSPERLFTWQLPHDYNPQATCPKTQAWLHETVGGAHDQVQVLRAYAKAVVTRRVDLQRYLETIGPGGTGKGTYTRLLQALVGNENTFATELKHLEANRFELSNLRGKVLLMITDAERYSGPINALKAITGQDFVRMEEKFKPQRTEIAPVMVVVAANEPIQSADYTSGLERRRLSMYFRHRPTTPRNLLSWKDSAWHGELASEIPGVLNWVLALPDALMEALLQQTTALVPSLQETWAYSLVDTNPLAEWANQALLLDDRTDDQGKPLVAVNVGRAHKMDRTNEYEHQDLWLYPNYRAWVDDTGSKPLSSRRFTGLLKDLFESQLRIEGVEHTDDMYGSRFHGIRFRRASDKDEPLLITKKSPPMTDMTGSMTAETRANDGYDACDAFLHSLYRHLPTPCPSPNPQRGVGGSIGGNFNNPSYLSDPSSVRSSDVIATSDPSSVRGGGVASMPPTVTTPLSEGSPAEPSFDKLTASTLRCSVCGVAVSFRTLTQLDGTELYVCNTCDNEVGRKSSTAPPSSNGPHALNAVPQASSASGTRGTSTLGAQPRSPNGASVPDQNTHTSASQNGCSRAADISLEREERGAKVGDWVLPLSAEGVIIPDSEFPPPYLISQIEPGSDGALYAQFMENGKYWPLAQCERTDPPASADGEAEVYSDTVYTEGVTIDETTRVHDGPANATSPHPPLAGGTSGTSGIVAQPGSPGGAADHSAEHGKGEITQGLQVGDWVWLCAANGDRRYLAPCQIHTIDRYPDGTPYAGFLNMECEWPLARCQHADPPALATPPANTEDF